MAALRHGRRHSRRYGVENRRYYRGRGLGDGLVARRHNGRPWRVHFLRYRSRQICEMGLEVGNRGRVCQDINCTWFGDPAV